MATIAFPFFQAIDGNGDPIAGAKLNFYRTGTSTRQDTYTTSALDTANANPVVADANGRFGPIYPGTSFDYKVVLTDASDVTISTIDPLAAAGSAGRASVADAAYAVQVTDRIVAYTSLSAARTVTLPSALSFTAGSILTIVDESGSASSTATLSVAPNGSDTINGLNTTQIVVSSAFGSAMLESDGTSKWTILRNSEGRRAVADAGVTVTARDNLIAYTSISTSRTVTLPAASAYPAGKRLVIADESGSVTQAIQISIAPNGSDTIAGSNTTQVCVNIARGRCELISNGSNGWTVLMWSVRYVNTLGGDVSLNNTSNFFDGPKVAQGSVGTWRCYGQTTFVDSAGGAAFLGKLWDATTTIAAGQNLTPSIGSPGTMGFTGMITTPAADLRISMRDSTSTSGAMVFNNTGTSKDCTLTVERIA